MIGRVLLAPWRAAALAALLAVLLGAAPGLTWDEPVYCISGYSYVDWIEKGGPVTPAWIPNHEHPPAAKLLYGAAIHLGGDHFGPLAPARAVGGLLFVALVALTAGTGARLFGNRAGLWAGFSLVLMPRVLAHAHLAELDLPMALVWMLAAALSLKGLKGWKGAGLLGLLWGLALLTKVNGIFLIAPLLAWGLLKKDLTFLQALAVLPLGCAVFFAGWPWLWAEPSLRIQDYLLNKSARWIVPSLYCGTVYDHAYPPWHYPLVMAGITLPPAILTAALLGAGRILRRKEAGAGWLGLHLAFTLGLACLPGVPRYDGVRLFLAAFPFLALLAGRGMDLALGALSGLRRQLALSALVVLPILVGLCALDPCLLSYYSPLVGGLKGAERLGMETTYWGDALTPELLAGLPRRPLMLKTEPMGEDYAAFLTATGWLPPGSRTGPGGVLLVSGRRSMLLPPGLKALRQGSGLALEREGVVLARICLAPSPRDP